MLYLRGTARFCAGANVVADAPYTDWQTGPLLHLSAQREYLYRLEMERDSRVSKTKGPVLFHWDMHRKSPVESV